ncbi:hypothetical protein [Parasphingorhabdus sp.]|uniref:hypothetical protein n=1 Tax=Parasphingorhabdus sp. TaxID=2709688 RepID=UPI003A912F19
MGRWCRLDRHIRRCAELLEARKVQSGQNGPIESRREDGRKWFWTKMARNRKAARNIARASRNKRQEIQSQQSAPIESKREDGRTRKLISVQNDAKLKNEPEEIGTKKPRQP